MQRVLVVIPHFFARTGEIFTSHDSGRPDSANMRAAALRTIIFSLHELFGQPYLLADHLGQRCISVQTPDRMQIDVFIIINEENHLLDRLDCPGDLYRRVVGIGDPRWLGLAAHKLIAQMQGRYDWYCYLEDDTAIEDPLFFYKLRHAYDALSAEVGHDAILQPYRFETARDISDGIQTGARKLYPDYESGGLDFQADPVRLDAFGRSWTFAPARHPHAGCFFLDQGRAELFVRSPYCGEAKEMWVTPPDTTATLAIMRTFRIFKAVPDSLPFLEVRHLRPSMIGKLKLASEGTYLWR
jgi:hypothetical protein